MINKKIHQKELEVNRILQQISTYEMLKATSSETQKKQHDFTISILRNNMRQLERDILILRSQLPQQNGTTIYTGLYIEEGASVNINESNIIGGKDNTVTISCEAKKQLNEIITQIESITQEIDGDRTDIADAILTIREELDSKIPRPKFLETAFNGLKAVGTGIVVEKIIPIVDKGLELISKL